MFRKLKTTIQQWKPNHRHNHNNRHVHLHSKHLKKRFHHPLMVASAFSTMVCKLPKSRGARRPKSLKGARMNWMQTEGKINFRFYCLLFCRKRRPSESDEEKIDKKTEENIQQVAMKNNLTEDAVKKILRVNFKSDRVVVDGRFLFLHFYRFSNTESRR